MDWLGDEFWFFFVTSIHFFNLYIDGEKKNLKMQQQLKSILFLMISILFKSMN
jgi:hypothetical protein